MKGTGQASPGDKPHTQVGGCSRGEAEPTLTPALPFSLSSGTGAAGVASSAPQPMCTFST